VVNNPAVIEAYLGRGAANSAQPESSHA
jgi:hypothetical protein